MEALPHPAVNRPPGRGPQGPADRWDPWESDLEPRDGHGWSAVRFWVGQGS